ncbi:hypothetical protein IGS68_33650 (plasmid) [Skermanella sp. TT6]|uniref:Uncharacterized protein n=1 Tax=Skermanella cutis TaxID=2775420 RepID=A0ABX7BH95_9PROT|nr:hypothetical protein [Skermanella sp. TT6]QQP93568.1 hypothetical protein IGS68_33650 [Skermanella sp. TT6]
MARTLTAPMEAATLADTICAILLVEAMFDSGAVRLWSGFGDLSWNGQTWIGAGNLLGLGTVEESSELRATGLDISLSGIPSDLLSLALNEPYQDRPCNVYLGALDVNTGALLADPYLIFGGRMDVMQIDDSGETARITISVESKLIDLERSRERRYEDADQRIDWPSDRFFKFVPSIQDAEIVWGRTA